MSDSRDFDTRARADTANTITSHVHGARSPPATDNLGLDRRGSTVSRASRISSLDHRLRFRRPSRSNTVTTYHIPEQSGPPWQPGAEPGIDTSAEDEAVPPQVNSIKADCTINIIDYSNSDVRHLQTSNDGLAEALAEPRPDDMPCRWISVNRLSWDVIKILGNKYNLHRLAIEDLIHTHTRTKVDWYADHAFIVLTLQKLVRLHQHKNRKGDCNCQEETDIEFDEKHSPPPKTRWWQRQSSQKQQATSQENDDVLPYYVSTQDDEKVNEFVSAHSGTSKESPVMPIRTLHRYESAQIPEHTAFMEKHSSLAAEDLAVSVEQVCIFLLADNTVISFFEQSAEDVERPIRQRLQSDETMLRRSFDASLLTQAIIDAIVDLAVPVKDAYNKARKELQIDAMLQPSIRTSRSLHVFGEEIDMLQNLFKPIVHLVNALRDHNSEPVKPQIPMTPIPDDHPPPSMDVKGMLHKTKRDREGAPTFSRNLSDYKRHTVVRRPESPATSVSITPLAHTYFGDVLDHCITMIQTLEQMDASANNISTLIFNTVGAKTNNFMMILAIVTVFFAPLTFISGYFGQNFSSGHGLDHPFSFFWIVSIPTLVVFMALVFVTFLWDWIRDFAAKRGIRAHRIKRNIARARFGR